MKIGIFASKDFYVYNYRLNLIKELIANDFEVFVCAKKTDNDFIKKIEKTGAIFLHCDLKRGIYLFSSFIYLLKIFKICWEYKFDICHNYSFKPVVIGSLAQKISGIKNIACSVTGLGYAYSSKSLKSKILKIISNFGYWIAGKLSKKIIFQNNFNLNYFVDKNIVPFKKAVLIRSSGVDTNYFSKEVVKSTSVEGISKKENKKNIVLISRLLWEKGVGEFIKSAEILKNKYENLNFILVGPVDKSNPDTVLDDNIKNWQEKNIIKYLGERKDIREILFMSDIFVFPSYYAEGVPRVVLEAMAMELPIVVAENFGTEEAIKDGETGIVIPPKNVEKLVLAIEDILVDEKLAKRLSRNSRKAVLENFSDEVIIKETMDVYFEIK